MRKQAKFSHISDILAFSKTTKYLFKKTNYRYLREIRMNIFYYCYFHLFFTLCWLIFGQMKDYSA